MSSQDHPDLSALYKATYGMLPFGIPYKGLAMDDIQRMLAGLNDQPRITILDQIRTTSDLLAFQMDSFRNIIHDRRLVSFYETRQTRQLEFDEETKRWKRTGGFVTTVNSESALLHLPDSVEDKLPVDSDRSMIVKFNTRNNRAYTIARDKLQQFERDAPDVVQPRFRKRKRK
ncbi:hypothetical protein QQS21_006400 [Conoideocrella luteorostrata]|uniref:Uncharacterized protein n=1 Tax=Conoideocrella luteorostrata TaxID=1105319 RepID=A0AAJ0CQN3_9HYPO|nr:hypothetical protein QQS21_006400 [Conoideocrella luteorostrata]